jgi:hypothetical protein
MRPECKHMTDEAIVSTLLTQGDRTHIPNPSDRPLSHLLKAKPLHPIAISAHVDYWCAAIAFFHILEVRSPVEYGLRLLCFTCG